MRLDLASRSALSAVALTGFLTLFGCSSTKPCNSGTVFATIDFDSATSAADMIEVDVSLGANLPTTTTLAHTPGQTQGTVEVYFPNGAGYPEGMPIVVTVVARKGSTTLGTASAMSAMLPSGCGTLTIRFGSGGDGGAGAGGGGGGAGGGGAGSGGHSGSGGAAGTGGAGEGGASGGASGSGGALGGSGGQAGQAGSGPDGGTPDGGGCPEGTTRSCTADGAMGNCASGKETCISGKWSACSIAPATADSCSVKGDDANCNGTPNDGCACILADTRLCSADGAKGNCAKGTETCTSAGKWGACSVVAATADSCTIKGDDANCNGVANDACPCVSGDTQACGPTAVGICKPGVATCTNGVWGACVGAVNKAPRDCTSTADNDCDGKPDNTIDTICQCASGGTQACGTHPGYDGKGPCKAGSQSCVVASDKTSSAWGTCTGAVGPATADTCVQGNDANCSGTANDGCLCINNVTTKACGYCNDGSMTCTDGKTGTYSACAGAGPGQPFTALPLAGAWTGGAYSGNTAAVALDCTGMVQFKGALSSSGTDATLFTLPAGLAPPSEVYIPADLISATNGRIHISSSGVAVVESEMAFTNATGFTSLEGVSFALSAKGFTPLTLQNGWTNAPFSTRNAAYSVVNGIVRFQGAISTSGTSLVPFSMPANASPSSDVYVVADLCGATKGRLHITSAGAVDIEYYGSGMSNATCFTSLEGISYALNPTGLTALSLTNSWANYGTRNAAVVNSNGIIRFLGAISSGTYGATMFTLPVGMRPAANVWIPVDLCNSGGGRLNISTSGTVSVQAETASTDATCFTSLDGAWFGL